MNLADEGTVNLLNMPIAKPANDLNTRERVLSGRYRLLSLVGEGGMGKVFLADDLQSRTVCAIKIMHTHLRADSSNRLRFEREAHIASKLIHPNVLNVTGYGVTETNEPFIVMEYLVGHSVHDLLKTQKRLSLSQFVPIFQQVCAGLQYAHDSDVVHRDMKPSNVMLLRNQASPAEIQVKLVDFGIAKCLKGVCPETGNPINMDITQPGELFGSPLYMSPEQSFGEEADRRSEIYALGCMMFEALTGAVPMRGKSPMATIAQRLQTRAPRLIDICPAGVFPEWLETLIARCLERDPADRFQTVAEVGQALSAM